MSRSAGTTSKRGTATAATRPSTSNHGIAAPTYWDMGERDRDFKWNNYLNRYHARHLDLMDVLAAYQARGRASLEHTALLLGLPGKLGMSGDQVFDYWKASRVAEIRAYCETDVFNTYLVWLRFQLIRGVKWPHGPRIRTTRRAG